MKKTQNYSQTSQKRSERKIIKQLNVKGKLIKNQEEILKQQQIFYKHLYKQRDRLPSSYNFFNSDKTKLEQENKDLCEGQLTEIECLNALKDMKNNKSPGSDY